MITIMKGARMNPEPLRGTMIYGKLLEFTMNQNGETVPYYEGHNDGVIKAFEKFKSAVEFYKMYRHDKNAFATDYPKLYYEYWKINENGKVKDYWSCWLFNYCFADVIK